MLNLIINEIKWNLKNMTICDDRCETCHHHVDDEGCILVYNNAPVFKARNNHLYSLSLSRLSGKIDLFLEMPIQLFDRITRSNTLLGELGLDPTYDPYTNVIRTSNHVVFQYRGLYRFLPDDSINVEEYKSLSTDYFKISWPYAYGEYYLQYSFPLTPPPKGWWNDPDLLIR